METEKEKEPEVKREIKRVYRDLMKLDIVCFSGEEYFVNIKPRIQSHHVLGCASYIETQIDAVIREERRLPEKLRKLTRKEMESFVSARAAIEILKTAHYKALYHSEDPIVNITTRRKVADWSLKFYDYLEHEWPRIYRVFKIT